MTDSSQRFLERASLTLAAVALLSGAACSRGEGGGPEPALEARLRDIRLPEGFRIEVYASGLPDARSLALGDRGTVFVGSRRTGVVRALRDSDGDHRADQVFVLASGLDMPNGVAFRERALYVAEVHRILRFDDVEERLAAPPAPVVLRDDLPPDRHHGWKFIRFGPDGWLYVPVGAPCNTCVVGDPYGTILRMSPDGSALQVVARGVRNSVGFDWHPETGELWFTDNGRDWLGDDLPPDELNRVTKPGLHFGFPRCHGEGIVDPELGGEQGCSGTVPPAWAFGAHVAALGMRFYTGTSFPAEYRGQVLVAQHGSWNRSSKVGYRVALVRVEGSRAVSEEPFAEGWLQGEEPWGRPVDVLQLPDGSVLLSDDHAGAIYRISHGADGAPSPAAARSSGGG